MNASHGTHASHVHAGHGHWIPRKRVAKMRRRSTVKECEPLGMGWVVFIAVGVAFAFFAAMIQITLR
ncbi:hypothetical protein FXN63_09690 [Pigmentiphaga aceris]|uniref:Uncharacterized protein n=1 Tax=Pigmentiphaga aceris TaxID=1940612 RepID=A0A5C0B0C6_9BURK|nr:hypothetical protein [Pigmentiphaga aceris]QEI06077.1 hypothetical protein FXN63_09690 [Pigmentiphaga aceris]